MSVRTAYCSPSFTRPMATPATGDLSGTPASISDSDAPQTVAIDDEPFDSRMSDTTRIAYGQLLSSGSTADTARSASAPCPISLRPSQKRDFTYAERRKIVMEHEALLCFALEDFEALHIVAGAKGGGD